MNFNSKIAIAICGVVIGVVMASGAYAADSASGTWNYKGQVSAIKYAWLVTGPSDMDPGRTVRRVVMSTVDIGAKLKDCKTFSCTDGVVTEGMTIDFGSGPRLNYWLAQNGQKVQYSGTARPETFTGTNDANHIAGSLAIDDIAAGGPKIDARFDVTRIKEFNLAR